MRTAYEPIVVGSSCVVVSVALLGLIIEHLSPTAIPYKQWVACWAFQIAELVLLVLAGLLAMYALARRRAPLRIRLFCCACAITVAIVGVLNWSSMVGHKVRFDDTCYLAMNGIEAARRQVVKVGKVATMPNVTQYMGRLPICPSGGTYSWAVGTPIGCSVHGVQHPGWVIWFMKTPPDHSAGIGAAYEHEGSPIKE